MATIETRYQHIVLHDEHGPEIAGTTMKVVELVAAQQAHGWSPDELAFQFPHLTLGQIHSALAYYWDHQATLDAEIARRIQLADTLRQVTPVAPVLRRLQARTRD